MGETPPFFMRIVTLLLIFGTAMSFGQTSDYELLRDAVTYLASDDLEGRFPGTEGEKRSAAYVRNSLKRSGLKTKYQKFEIILNGEVIKSKNVLGFINHKSSETILVSAHYDHLGWGEQRSLDTRKEIHNGADDNASGVALMLWLADTLAQLDVKANLLFVSYSGHELGLQGSEHFEKLLGDQYGNIVLAMNFDMVGRMDNQKTVWYDLNESLTLPDLTSMECNWKRSPKDRISKLDSRWLAEDSIPSITLTTGLHLDYHKSSDEIQYIQYEGMEMIARDVLQFISSR